MASLKEGKVKVTWHKFSDGWPERGRTLWLRHEDWDDSLQGMVSERVPGTVYVREMDRHIAQADTFPLTHWAYWERPDPPGDAG